MSRPNRARAVYAEEHLADRIARERSARGWSMEGLAKRLVDVGCSINGSAIFKIEQGSPRRRIAVDELVALAKVFGVGVEDLLTDSALLADRRVAPLLDRFFTLDDEARRLMDEMEQVREQVSSMAAESGDGVIAAVERYFASADTHGLGSHPEGARAQARQWLSLEESRTAAMRRSAYFVNVPDEDGRMRLVRIGEVDPDLTTEEVEARLAEMKAEYDEEGTG